MPRFRNYMPQGLYGRALAIIILPVVVMQIAITFVFFDDLWDSVSRRMATGMAGDIALTVALYEKNPTPEAFAELSQLVYSKNQLSVALRPGDRLPTTRRASFFSVLDRTIDSALDTQLDRPYWFDARRDPNFVDVRVPVQGGVMRFIGARKRAYVTSGHVFLLWIIGFTALLTTVSVLFIRNQVRPILRLAKVAEAFGRGEDLPEDYRPSGAREVRQAAQSVLKMHENIKSHVEQRTQLLAAVSHDLRTPLTRLKLELAMAPAGADTAAMRRDLDDMEHMLDEYLTFARGQWTEEPDPADMGVLLAEAAAPLGDRVQTAITMGLVANVRASALKRCLSNLLQNAVAHAPHVRAEVRRNGAFIEIAVDDDGPGIAPELHEEALSAFTRLDPSRNQNAKGVGLGLAIARDVARGHGGDLLLSTSPMGGLRALVRIPAMQ